MCHALTLGSARLCSGSIEQRCRFRSAWCGFRSEHCRHPTDFASFRLNAVRHGIRTCAMTCESERQSW